MQKSFFLAAAAVVLSTPNAFACTAGGVPCDQVYREQLQGIDQHRIDNLRRQQLIEQIQHQHEIDRIKRANELKAARSGQTASSTTTVTNQVPNAGPSTNAQLPAECRAFPAMCSAYK